MNPLSPLDGRYAEVCSDITTVIGEDAVLRKMYQVELDWLHFLSKNLPDHSELSQEKYDLLKVPNIQDIRNIEQTTGHEVKAIEYYLRGQLTDIGLGQYCELVHFGCTSEDIMNIAYASAFADAVEVIRRLLSAIIHDIDVLATSNSGLAMLARTHGQPASPTTVGKEFRNYERRLAGQLPHLEVKQRAKLNGATGNYNAFDLAYPNINWIMLTSAFILKYGLEANRHTTQIEPHERMAETMHALCRINNILTDLSCDMWQYISLGYFQLRVSRVGSSTMPHKINPIEFENAEGNFGLANALLQFMASKLTISRMQRDLSGSTVKRNLGVALGHCYLGYRSVLRGLSNSEVNQTAVSLDLSSRREVLAEAYQTVLRKYGITNAYDVIREVLFNNDPADWDKDLDEQMVRLISALDIPEEAKDRLYSLSPSSYIGQADYLASHSSDSSFGFL